MKIYRVNFYCNNIGTSFSWHPNKKEAEKDLKRIKELYKRDPLSYGEILKVIFPRDKKGIIQWLNDYIFTDNG